MKKESIQITSASAKDIELPCNIVHTLVIGSGQLQSALTLPGKCAWAAFKKGEIYSSTLTTSGTAR